ncbi:DNRLRE domain-containing protein [Streptosporangium sp. NPDC004631]
MLIADQTTESSMTYANQDGTFTTETVSGVARIKRDDRWIPVDSRLAEVGGVLRPKAARADLEFSAGGGSPFAKLIRGESESVALSWPTPLPKPVVKDNTATYPEVVPGGDLVVTSLVTGMRFDIVLRERPSSPVEFKIPIGLEGLSLGRSENGRLQLSNGKDKIVAASAVPVMWQAGVSGRAGGPHGRPEDRGRAGKITANVEAGALVLRPDPSFLADPATKYPVTVDPTVLLPLSHDTDVNSVYDWNNEGSEFLKVGMDAGAEKARGYLRFDTTGLPSAVTAAQLVLRNVDAPACGTAVGAGVQVRRVTSSWDASTIDWSPQPSNTTTGATVSTEGSQHPGCGSGYMKWDVTTIAQTWASGTANYGLVLGAPTETGMDYWVYASSEETIEFNSPPKLSITYTTPPTIGALSVTPSAGTLTSSATPSLRAQLNDADGGALSGQFQVEHDPAVPGQGTGSIWSGSASNVQAGTDAAVTVPSGPLSNGWKIRWRARAYDGTTYSAWSDWQYLTIDTTAPAAPTVSCVSYSAGVWSAKQPNPVSCTLDTASTDATEYVWNLNDPQAVKSVATTGGDAKVVSIDPGQGWHTLYARARDAAGNTSGAATYTFGVGVGQVTKPLNADRTQAAVTLASHAEPGRTGVRYEYRADVSSTGIWASVPVAHVTVPGSGTPISGWPQTRSNTSQPFADLYWDVAATVQAAGRGDGPLEVRGCFTTGTAEQCSDPVTISLQRAAFGASYATTSLGPGSVALLTGDYSINSGDVNVFGLSVVRGHTALTPPNATGAAGVFGPGWTASFPSGGSGVAGARFEDHSADGYVLFVGADGSQLTYTVQDDGTFAGVGDSSDGSTVVKDSSTQFTHTDPGSVKTTLTLANGQWGASSIDEPGSEDAITYTRDAQGRVTRMLAPVPSGGSCSSGLVAGCKALNITYATTTTASGIGSGWGDYAGLVKSISYTAYDPVTSAMKTAVVAAYSYDSTGHLRTVSDTRINLTTTYYYTGGGRISQITPPGQNPWYVEYDTSGRLAHVQREAGTTDLTQSVAYGVPISSPIDLTGSTVATWGQVSDLPRVGTAVFPNWRVPSRTGTGAYQPAAGDWEYGHLTYVDVNGRAVNTAVYGAGSWQISSTGYDGNGNAVWELSPGNLLQALTPTADTAPYVAGLNSSAERANLLATVRTYNEFGDLLSGDGPAHRITLASGAVVSARQRSSYVYDEGKPDPNIGYHLVTTTTTEPVVIDGTATPGTADIHVSKTGYAPIVSGDTSGWELRLATSQTTVVPGSTDIVHRTRYDSAGREVERWLPASSGSDAGATVTTYYTAGTHPSVTACGSKPQWAGLVCKTASKAQPAGTTVPAATFGYGYYGQGDAVTETSGSTVRTTTTNHDAAGRVTGTHVVVTPTSAGGTAVPDSTISYESSTGLQSQVTAGGSSVVITYDALGRVLTTTDADGNTSTIGYDTVGRVASRNDGKGTTTYGYDGTDAAGQSERRGLVTSVNTGTPGTFTGAYDGEGKLVRQDYPNGLSAISRFNGVGEQVKLSYVKSGTTWLEFAAVPDIEGRTVSQTSPGGGAQSYTYDPAGRLTKVADTYAGSCVTRVSGFNLNTNRTSLSEYPPAANGTCSVSTTPVTQNYTYDAADRITGSGYTYDEFGRTSSVPGAHVAGGVDLEIGYHVNDTVASLTQGAHTREFTLDPLGRIRSVTSGGGVASGTITNHYTGSGDSPAWIEEIGGGWTRNVVALNGLGATQSSDGTVTLLLSDLHGDIAATAANSVGATGITAYFEQGEYGTPSSANITNPNRYGWLGGAQRSAEALGGLVLMGARLYNPTTGRFLQVDPVVGGSANAYDYCHGDPVNCVDLDGRAAWQEGAWRLYKIVTGVWINFYGVPDMVKADLLEFVDSVACWGLCVDWDYRYFGQSRTIMRIERAVDVKYVCAKKVEPGRACPTKPVSRERWRSLYTTHYRAKLIASHRILGFPKRYYREWGWYDYRTQTRWVYGKPDPYYFV